MKTNLCNTENLTSEYDKHIKKIVHWMKEYAQWDGDRYGGGHLSFLRTGGILQDLNDFDGDVGRFALYSSDEHSEDQAAVLLDLYIRDWTDIDRNASALEHSRRRALEAAFTGIKLTVEVGYPGDSVTHVSPLINYELIMPAGVVMKRPCIDELLDRPYRISEIFLNSELVAVRTVDIVLVNSAHRWLIPPIESEEPDEIGYLRRWGAMDDRNASMNLVLIQALHHIEAHPDEKVRFRAESERGLRTICADDLRSWPEDAPSPATNGASLW